jgi:hypothetical protein
VVPDPWAFALSRTTREPDGRTLVAIRLVLSVGKRAMHDDTAD